MQFFGLGTHKWGIFALVESIIEQFQYCVMSFLIDTKMFVVMEIGIIHTHNINSIKVALTLLWILNVPKRLPYILAKNIGKPVTCTQ